MRGSTTAAIAPVTGFARWIWLAVAAVAFHVAQLSPALGGFMVVFLFALLQLSRVSHRMTAMNNGWLLGLAVYAPHLGFFWTIFGPAAIALWLVLAFWLGLFLALLRLAREKAGPVAALFVAPWLWMGLEYVRCEVNPLRFTWLTPGFAFSGHAWLAEFGGLGIYGLGAVLMAVAALAAALRRGPAAAVLAGAVLALGALDRFPPNRPPDTAAELQVAGVQLEFPAELEVPLQLEKLRQRFPQVPLFVLPEYTFQDEPPKRVRDWCRRHGKYLIVGGKSPVGTNQFYNTAFVIGPDGNIVFQQVKAQPIQFMKDGLPAPAQRVWESPWGKIGLCVCYDLSYTRVIDELARQGARAVIAPTMDIEEWGDGQHRLHGRVAPMRAAEYRIPLFRVCSSGISQSVNRHGTVESTAPFPGPAEPITGTLHLGSPARRPLDRWLVWPGVALAGVLGVGGFLGALRGPRRDAAPPAGQPPVAPPETNPR